MRRHLLATTFLIAALPLTAFAQTPASSGPYHIVDTAKVGGDGGWDYVYADAAGRRLYIPRSGPTGGVTVFDLDTLKPVGTVPGINGHGTAVDPKSGHAFVSSKPVAMIDTKTLALIKTIDVQGSPDGILFDVFNERVYIFSHSAPNATVIDAASGTVLGTIDLGGAPEEAVTDGAGHIYVDLEDKDQVAVVDAKAMTVTAHYGLNGKGGGPGALAIDAKNHILFVACHTPANMVIMNAMDGSIITALPIGTGVDAAAFNPATMEAFSSQGDGTLTVIKESSPTSFAVEQTVQTMSGARTMSLDAKTGKLFTVSAERGPAPVSDTPPAPGSRPRPGPMIADSFTILAIGK